MAQLKKALTLYGLTMIAIGSCVGSGIFLTPSDIASHLMSPWLIILVWGVGGVVALTGALTFAELGARFPAAGGVYVFLKEAYGDFIAFLYGWVTLLVITSGAIAALGLAFARYVDFVIPLGGGGVQAVGILAIAIVTLVNIAGVKMGELFSNVFTGVKLLGILAVIGVGVWVAFAEKVEVDFSPAFTPERPGSAFALALIGVLWSYGGWHHASFLAGEAKNARRTVPLAMIIGALVVTATYVLTNIAYLYLLPVEEIAASGAVAADAIQQRFSDGAFLIAVLIAISTFGTAGIYTLSAPRIYYAMAKDGLFFKGLSVVNVRFLTPVNAILIQSAWAVILILFWGTFENLITYVVFMDWIFMLLAAVALFIFRKRKEVSEGLYRTPGFPVVPLIFIGISAWFIIMTLISKPAQAWGGLVMLGLGFVGYLYFKGKKRGAEGKCS